MRQAQFNSQDKGIIHRYHEMNPTSMSSFKEWLYSVQHLKKRQIVLVYLRIEGRGFSSRQLWYDLKIERSTLCGILNRFKKKGLVHVELKQCPHTGKTVENYSLKEKEQPQQSLF